MATTTGAAGSGASALDAALEAQRQAVQRRDAAAERVRVAAAARATEVLNRPANATRFSATAAAHATELLSFMTGAEDASSIAAAARGDTTAAVSAYDMEHAMRLLCRHDFLSKYERTARDASDSADAAPPAAAQPMAAGSAAASAGDAKAVDDEYGGPVEVASCVLHTMLRAGFTFDTLPESEYSEEEALLWRACHASTALTLAILQLPPELGADVNALDSSGQSVFAWAVRTTQSSAVVRLFLERGVSLAHVNATPNPLHAIMRVACECAPDDLDNAVEMARLLLARAEVDGSGTNLFVTYAHSDYESPVNTRQALEANMDHLRLRQMPIDPRLTRLRDELVAATERVKAYHGGWRAAVTAALDAPLPVVGVRALVLEYMQPPVLGDTENAHPPPPVKSHRYFANV